MDKKNGGPAFPIPGAFDFKGISKRDYFATHASEEDILNQQSIKMGMTRAQARYAHADSMLRAREQS